MEAEGTLRWAETAMQAQAAAVEVEDVRVAVAPEAAAAPAEAAMQPAAAVEEQAQVAPESELEQKPEPEPEQAPEQVQTPEPERPAPEPAPASALPDPFGAPAAVPPGPVEPSVEAAAAAERAAALDKTAAFLATHASLELAAEAYHEAAMLFLRDAEAAGADDDLCTGVLSTLAERCALRTAELREAAEAAAAPPLVMAAVAVAAEGAAAAEEGDAAEEAVPGVLAPARLLRVTPPKPAGTRYRCIGSGVVRKGSPMDSETAKVDKLAKGTEIVVHERLTLEDGTIRLRFEGGLSFGGLSFGGGWTSEVTSNGKVLVERLDPESDVEAAKEDEAVDSPAALKNKVVAVFFGAKSNEASLNVIERQVAFTLKLKRFYDVVADREAAREQQDRQ